jgi:hypothetical protein
MGAAGGAETAEAMNICSKQLMAPRDVESPVHFPSAQAGEVS